MNIRKLTCSEPIVNELTVGDFWVWAFSDILSNRNRSLFAEFLVASALETHNQPRVEWGAVDATYYGNKIEIKCSAYLQNWQRQLSDVRFDISKKRTWGGNKNKSTSVSDCYIFCIYTQADKNKVDVLDLNSWMFYVISAQRIEKVLGQSISLSKLEELFPNVKPVRYENLKKRIHYVLGLK
jgi:hypothetical protein